MNKVKFPTQLGPLNNGGGGGTSGSDDGKTDKGIGDGD